MLTIPDLNRLKVFHAVYVHQSIVRAANALNVTRSAVSQSLKALEKDLKTHLFVRDSKKVRPTSAAETLFKLMAPFLEDLGSVLREIETGRQHPTGHLRIGAPLDFGSDYLTTIIGQFRQAHPTVSFELILGVPVKQLELLVDGKIDLAFIDNGDVFTKSYPISIETIQREDFVLVSSTKFYNEHIKGDHSLAKLQHFPVVDYLVHAPVARMWFKHHFNKTLPNLAAVYSAESVRGVLKAISLNMGIGVVPAHLIEKEASRFKVISTEKKNLLNQIALALPLSKTLTLTEKSFIKFVKSQI